MSLDIGELVGTISISHKGVKAGIDAAKRDVKTGMGQITQEAGKGGDSAGKAFGDRVTSRASASLTKLTGVIAGAFAAEKVITFLGDSVKAASDLNETVSASGVIFGAQAGAMEKWASTAASSFGLSKAAALSAATGIGDMLLQLGDTDEQAAKTSQSVVAIAADLGSFKNLETGDVLDRINAALRGEYDSLQAVIPNINATRVEQEALAETGKASATALTAQEKAHATLAIIQKDGARAQGDFARTSDGLANSQKIAAAKAEELKTKIGQQLLPAVQALTQFTSDTALPALSALVDILSKVGGAVASIPGPVKAAIVALVAFHLLKGPVSSMLDTVRLKAMYAGDAFAGMGKGGAVKAGLGGIKAGLGGIVGLLGGPWGIALAAGTTALTYWWQEAAKTDEIADQLRQTIDKTTGSFTAQSKATVKQALLGDLSTDDIRRMQQLGVSFDDLAQAALDGGPALADARAKLDGLKSFDWLFFKDDADIVDGLNASLGRSADAAERSKVVNGELAPKVAEAGDAAGTAAPRVGSLATKTSDLETAAKKAKEEQQKLAQAILDVYDAASGADSAEIQYEDSVSKVNERIAKRAELEAELKKANTPEERKRIREELADYAKTLDVTTQAGRDNKQSLIDLAEQAKSYAEEMFNAGEKTSTVKDHMKDAREEFIQSAIKMGASRTEAKKMADEYGITTGFVDDLKSSMDEIPSEVVSRLKVESQKAFSAINTFQLALAKLDGRVVTTVLRTVESSTAAMDAGIGGVGGVGAHGMLRRAGGGPIPGYAGGTLVGPGTGTSDSILAMVAQTGRLLRVSAGEFVSTDASRRRNQGALEAGNRGATLQVAGSGPVELDDRTIRKLAKAMAAVRPVVSLDAINAGLAVG